MNNNELNNLPQGATGPETNESPAPTYFDTRDSGEYTPPYTPPYGATPDFPQAPGFPAQPAPQPAPAVETEPPMRIRDWLLMWLLMSIPCVGFIMLFIWGFSSEPGKKSRASFCKATLIWYAITAGLTILVYVAFFVFALMFRASFS